MYQQYYPPQVTWAHTQQLPQAAGYPEFKPQQQQYYAQHEYFHDNKNFVQKIDDVSKLGETPARLSPVITSCDHGYQQQPTFTYMHSRASSRESPSLMDPAKTEPNNLPLNFSMDKKEKVGSYLGGAHFQYGDQYAYSRDPVPDFGYFPCVGETGNTQKMSAFDWITTNKHRQEVQAKPGSFVFNNLYIDEYELNIYKYLFVYYIYIF